MKDSRVYLIHIRDCISRINKNLTPNPFPSREGG